MGNTASKETQELYKIFVDGLTKLNIKISKNNFSRYKFHLRAQVGDNYKEILNSIIQCEILNTNESLSQAYKTQLIKTKDEIELLFVNNGKPQNGILRTKQLTPDNLGFSGKTYDVDELYKELNNVLKNIDIKLKECIYSLINSSYLNKNNINTDGVSNSDINNIAKDFGELTGALWCMIHYFKNVKYCTFPAASNAALIDYYLTKNDNSIINISAKAGIGAAPSLTAVSGLIEEKIIQPKKIHIEVADFVTEVKKQSALDTILIFSKKFKTPGYKEILNVGGQIETYSLFEDQISKMKWEEVKKQFLSVWEIMKRSPNEENANKLFKTNFKKSGVILSPLGYHLIDIINNNNLYVEFLNYSLNSLNTKQLYLNINNNIIQYTMKAFNTAKFLYHFDSNIKNPNNKKISFKMLK
jgi:hypothetical protein